MERIRVAFRYPPLSARGEGNWRGRTGGGAEEKGEYGVGDVDAAVVIRIGGIETGWSDAVEEEELKGIDGVG